MESLAHKGEDRLESRGAGTDWGYLLSAVLILRARWTDEVYLLHLAGSWNGILPGYAGIDVVQRK